MKKRLLISLMLFAVLLVFTGCSTDNGTDSNNTQTPEITVSEGTVTEAGTSELTLTPEELSQYNGQNGNPAYIAVDGVIYDVTNIPQWNGGKHNGFTAGQDLTNEIKTISPHGVSKLTGLIAIGKLAE